MLFQTKELIGQMLDDTLRTVGVTKGLNILDFGCGTGDYSLPSSQIIGSNGILHAIDMDDDSLSILRKKINAKSITNINVLNTNGELLLPLENDSVEFVLLYDVLHHYYFNHKTRNVLYQEIKRVSKSGTIISVYPKHIESEIIISEMESEGFKLQEKFYLDLLHYHVHEKDYLFNFIVD